jgi:crossover junction endodeoxyribonuclease RusA
VPQPKGSTKSFVYAAKNKTTGAPIAQKNGQPLMLAATTSDNPRLKEWQTHVASVAQRIIEDDATFSPLDGPVSLALAFHLSRPVSLPKKVIDHTKKPDLDKLVRAVKDALKGVMYRDDAQVVDLHASKVYATGPVGVFVTVEG